MKGHEVFYLLANLEVNIQPSLVYNLNDLY